jgi:hypothetical protein
MAHLHRSVDEYNNPRGLYHGDLHGVSYPNFPHFLWLTSDQQNLLVDESESGQPVLWITDFGLSGDTARGHMMQASIITQRFFILAPELFRYFEKNEIQCTEERMCLMRSADIYSLGIVAYWVMNSPMWTLL